MQHPPCMAQGVPSSESGLLQTIFFLPGTANTWPGFATIPIAAPIPSHHSKCLRANLPSAWLFPRALEKRQRIGLNVRIQIGVISH